MIEGLNICHKHAGELICLGSALMPFPVWDLKWMVTATHPSSAEIFKVVAEHALASRTVIDRPKVLIDDTTIDRTFQLPATVQLHPSEPLPDWLTREHCLAAITSKHPRAYYAACFALDRLSASLGAGTPCQFRLAPNGGIDLIEPADTNLSLDPDARVCTVERGRFRVTVDYRD
jgi:hypothetical protein